MKRLLKSFAILLTAVPAAVLIGATPAANASTTCPTYYGCIHANSSYNSTVTWQRSAYGTYALYGWNGSHYVQNNQTGGAYMVLLDKYKHTLHVLEDGADGRPPSGMVVDMGPVYYVQLEAGPSCWPRCG